MSSHHVIRDEQEPPVLVLQLHDNWVALRELLGWSPTLLIDPSLAQLFLLRQTRIDGYLLKDHTCSDTSNSDLPYKDDGFASSILDWVGKKAYTAINLFCDQKVMLELFDQLKLKSLRIPFIFFTEEGKFILKPTSIFKKWYPKDFKLKILNTDLVSSLNLSDTEFGFVVENDGFVVVQVRGSMVLMQELEVDF